MKTLASMLQRQLNEWGNYQPEYCQRLDDHAYRVTNGAMTFDVEISSESEPTQTALNFIDATVSVAAEARHWHSSVRRETFDSDLCPNFVAQTKLGCYTVERECCERAIARLQSYLAANRGDY